MPSCVMEKCRNNSGIQKKGSGITFHKFPGELSWKKNWIRAVRQNRNDIEWMPSKFSVVCSLHFEECDFYNTKGGYRRIKKYSIPKKDMSSSAVKSEKSDVSDEEARTTSDIKDTDFLIVEAGPSNERDASRMDTDAAGASGHCEQIDTQRAESPNSLENVDISDLDYVFDTPSEYAHRQAIEELENSKNKLWNKYRTLAKQNKILKKKLSSVSYILKILLKKKVISKELFTELNLKNVVNSVKQTVVQEENDSDSDKC